MFSATGSIKDKFKKKCKDYYRRHPSWNVFAGLGIILPVAQSEQNNTLTTSNSEGQPNASSSTTQLPLRRLSSVHVSSTPYIEIDYTGSSSDEGDVRRKKVILKRRFMLMVKKLQIFWEDGGYR